MSQCPTCGGALQPGAVRCVKCGAAVQPEPAMQAYPPQPVYPPQAGYQPVPPQVVVVPGQPPMMNQPMRVCQKCQTATPQVSAPIHKRGLSLSGGQWAMVVFLGLLWFIPGLIALIYYANQNRWLCSTCGHSNVFKG